MTEGVREREVESEREGKRERYLTSNYNIIIS